MGINPADVLSKHWSYYHIWDCFNLCYFGMGIWRKTIDYFHSSML